MTVFWNMEIQSILHSQGEASCENKSLCEFRPECLKTYTIYKFVIQIGNERSTTKWDFLGIIPPFEVYI